MEQPDAVSQPEPKLILGVPGVGAGLLARESVEWLLGPELGLETRTRLYSELQRWLDEPLPGKYFGVTAVHDDELAHFRMLIQRAGWTYGSPDDVQEFQLAVARSEMKVAAGSARATGRAPSRQHVRKVCADERVSARG